MSCEKRRFWRRRRPQVGRRGRSRRDFRAADVQSEQHGRPGVPCLSYFPVRFGSRERGHMIVAMSPRNSRETIVERLFVVEGDIVETEMNKGEQRTVIIRGHYRIEGDYRSHLYDSISFGPISRGLAIAKVPATEVMP